MKLFIFTLLFNLMSAAAARAQCPDAATVRAWENEAEKCAILHGKTREACDPTQSRPLILAQQNLMRAGAQMSRIDAVSQTCNGYTVAAGGVGKALSGFIATCSLSRRTCLKTCGDVLAKLEKSLNECTQTDRHEALEEVRNRVRPPGLECDSYKTIVSASNSQLEQMRPALEQARSCSGATSAVAAGVETQAPAKAAAPVSAVPSLPKAAAATAVALPSARPAAPPKAAVHLTHGDEEEPSPAARPAVVGHAQDFDPKPKEEIHNEDEAAARPEPRRADVYEPMKSRVPVPKAAPRAPNPEDKWNFGYSHTLPSVPSAPPRPDIDQFRPNLPAPHQGSADLASQEPVNPPAPAPSWDPKMIDAGVTSPSSNLWLKVRTRYTDQRPSLIPEGGPETER